eukprot:8153592-Alexandrium_andersonii.AAC.1
MVCPQARSWGARSRARWSRDFSLASRFEKLTASTSPERTLCKNTAFQGVRGSKPRMSGALP